MPLPNARWHAQLVETLRDLVRIDTTNPPGNETGAALYLQRLLDATGAPGIETHLVEPAPGRGSLVARLRGTGEAKPLMILAHIDVVAANADEWSHPPFAADLADGFLWGRGSTDNKHMAAAGTLIMLALAAQRRPLKRDLILACTADEEHGGRMGIGHLVRERREWVAAEAVLNEGGGAALRLGEQLFFTCQTAEKGVCRTVWQAQAKGGHASQPRADLATFKLARAIARLGDGHLGPRVIPTMRRAIEAIAAARPDKPAKRVARLLDEGCIEEALQAVGFDNELMMRTRTRSLFYDTASVTGLRAGDPASINVIPLGATAYCDGRVLPGQTREGFLDLLRRQVGDEVSIELYGSDFSAGLESSTEAPIVRTIQQVITARCPGAQVIPWQCAGSTDAKHLVPRGIPVYGFIPTLPLPDGVEGAGAHAANERMWLGELPFMFDTLYDIVERFCSEDAEKG